MQKREEHRSESLELRMKDSRWTDYFRCGFRDGQGWRGRSTWTPSWFLTDQRDSRIRCGVEDPTARPLKPLDGGEDYEGEEDIREFRGWQVLDRWVVTEGMQGEEGG